MGKISWPINTTVTRQNRFMYAKSIHCVTKYVYNKKERQTKHERRETVKSYSIFSLSNFILCDVNKVK